MTEDGLGLEKIVLDLVAKQRKRYVDGQLVELFAKKLATFGIVATPRLKARYRRWINTERLKPFTIRDARLKGIDAAVFEFTKREVRNLKARVARHAVRASKIAMDAVVGAAPGHIRPIYDAAWPAQSRRLERQMRGFLRRLDGRYKKGFELFAMQLALSHELGAIINRQVRQYLNTGEKGQITEALTRLHGRACQIGSEVLALLRAGHADGAMARWRTLHEVSVVARFIVAKGGDIGTRYLAHDVIESRRAARGYQTMASRLRHKPISQRELDRISRAADALVAEYGPAFDEEYGWAAHALNIRRPKITDIERFVELDHLRPYYKLASHNVHANPKGILISLGIPDSRQMLASGPSNLGLTDPAQNASLSLAQITTTLATYWPSLEALAVVGMLNELPVEIGHVFWKAEKAIVADERKLHAEREK